MIYYNETKESFVFSKKIIAGTNEVLQKIVPKDARVRGIRIIMPDGPDGTLLLTPKWYDAQGVPHDLLTFSDDRTISGNDFNIEIPIDVPVEAKSVLGVEVFNQSANNYNVLVFMEIDYMEIKA